MSQAYSDNRKKIIEQIASLAKKSKHRELFDKFIHYFYEHVASDYLTLHSPEQLYKTAKECWVFVEKRSKEKTRLLRVFNPDDAERKTIIQINCPDSPFLVDSLTAEIMRQGIAIYQIIHPVIRVTRDSDGIIKEMYGRSEAKNGASMESFMHFEIARVVGEGPLESLRRHIEYVLDSVRCAVEDWAKMLDKLAHVTTFFTTISERSILPFSKGELSETKDFLDWIAHHHFTFLGYIEHRAESDGKNILFKPVKSTSLGVLRKGWQTKSEEPLPLQLSMPRREVPLFLISKSNSKSRVHRDVHMDYVAITEFSDKGEIIGQHVFVGLFTSSVYYQSTKLVPIIRNKIESVIERAGFTPDGHNGKTLMTILETYPRDELFQISDEELFNTCMGILELTKRPQVKLFVRQDAFRRFFSCIIFVPKDRFNTELREKMQKILEREFKGQVTDHFTQVTELPLARVQIMITIPEKMPSVSIASVEKKLIEVGHSWTDALHDLLIEEMGEIEGEKFFMFYKEAFSVAYTGRYKVRAAYQDALRIERAIKSEDLFLHLYQKTTEEKNFYQLKLYSPKTQLALSDILPILENLGFFVIDETSFSIRPAHADYKAWVHHLKLRVDEQIKDKIDFKIIKKEFEEAFLRIWHKQMENDVLNTLIVRAGLTWREVTLIRAYSKYMSQTAIGFGFPFIIRVFQSHPAIIKLMAELFHSRFAIQRQVNEKKISDQLESALTNISNITEDRILRAAIDTIKATLRTNFYQKDKQGNWKSYISFKLNSAKVPELPLPRPYAEIFVYSYKVEGIHLRGGKVARGGLRWSDRTEDFRTEVLGLMKAQMVKNAVIVPVGSKGGFVVKYSNSQATRDQVMQEAIECYKIYLRGLLDITDNIVGGRIVAPKDVVRHDEDDPYLVVAADKGTATFSDIANNVSAEYHFWLGDAFASGGSAGYDHKKMAITARGAWVSVRKHFLEIGIDPNKQDITVIGIGDMAGDVFGNGMLQSGHIKLLGAFNHQHIFIDPNPDAKESFKERKRLFNLPRSSWGDYNLKLISKGGGIFDRRAKLIKLTPEIRRAFVITKDTVTPDELIKIMLKAEVDLLWNGGIGTYVKATLESNEQVGDKSNDNVRINGYEVRAKVIAEGGNLGFTQRGRIEYALKGGRLNNDAIDNSAGVDCSDHEVNIKICLSKAVEKKSLSKEKRDKLLSTMTDDVASLVLRDNFLQNQAISIAEHQGATIIEMQARLMRRLEQDKLLNRAIEFLPEDEVLAERALKKKGLTRPELAVLLAYSKIAVYEEILRSDLPDDPYFLNDLKFYFPVAMQKGFTHEIEQHPLRREIIATFVTNSMVNRVGSTFLHQLREETGLNAAAIARAYTATRDSFGLRPVWRAIEALEGKVSPTTQIEMFLDIGSLVEKVTQWLLRNVSQPMNVEMVVKEFSSDIANLTKSLEKMMSPVLKTAYQRKIDHYEESKIPPELARKVAQLEALVSAPAIIHVAGQSKASISAIGEIYYTVGMQLSLGWLRHMAENIKTDSYWHKLSIKTLVNELFDQQMAITSRIISSGKKTLKPSQIWNHWVDKNHDKVTRCKHAIDDLKSQKSVDLSMLVIASRHVGTLL